MSVHVVVDDRDARQRLDKLADALTPSVFGMLFNRSLEEHFRSQIRNRFAAGGDSASGPWAPLSEETVKTKRREGLMAGINTATGETKDFLLGGTLDSNMVGGNVEMVFPRENPGQEVETRLRIAETGRKGKQGRDTRGRFKKKSKGQPARPILVVDNDDMRFLVDAVTTGIEEYVR